MRDLQGRTTPEHDVNLNKNLWAAQEIGIAYLSIAPLRNLSKFTSFWFPLHWPLRMSVPSPLPLSGDVPAGLGPGGALGAATAKALAKPHAAEARRRRSLVFLLRTQTCPLVLIGKDHLFWVVGPKGEGPSASIGSIGQSDLASTSWPFASLRHSGLAADVL